ncbi:MAG TPA: hemerythrin domain-containing protein [Gammaproteobacteria bacterium]|nr:hemerythrin domain-containing protein [Gammaproteobacteria bacterium]
MATKKRAPRTQPQMRAAPTHEKQDAIALLKADHREVEGLFREFEAADSNGDKHSLAARICGALELHARIEEEIFYPSFVEATGEQDMYDEALVEHEGAKKLIADIEASAPGESQFDAKLAVLSEMIKHHVKEEERFGGMFSKARRAKMDLGALGAELAARKRAIAHAPARKRSSSPGGGSRPPFMGAATLDQSSGGSQSPRRAT